ncbi:hypothetical protein [Streptomyces sp. IBSBF 2390]|uniref:hypothetical protein n=1 Tax=Streptomyces sp. IBSBF 2390 TaxID=2903533 RepID=UPI002FDBCE12
MEQPIALFNAEPAVPESAPAADTGVWEADLADVAALPLTSLDGLAPLRPDARLLEEVLRERGGMRGGGEGGPARAE